MSEALSYVSNRDASRVEHGLTCSILSLVNMIVRSSLSTVQTTGRSTPRYLSYEAKSLVVSAESRNSTAGLVSSSSQPSVTQRTYLQPPLYACQCQLNGTRLTSYLPVLLSASWVASSSKSATVIGPATLKLGGGMLLIPAPATEGVEVSRVGVPVGAPCWAAVEAFLGRPDRLVDGPLAAMLTANRARWAVWRRD